MPGFDASIERTSELESQSDASEFPSNTFAGLHTLSPCTLAFVDESVEKRYVHHKRSHAQFKRGIWISRWVRRRQPSSVRTLSAAPRRAAGRASARA
jgi:hypothetical protein